MNDTEWFSSLLAEWYAEHARTLPWRGIEDPYRIWVSEIILQQTRVAQGLDYYLRFIKSFPSVEALAAAEEEQVLALWQGLGYYSRARLMHEAARRIVRLGHFPSTLSEIRTLPGVGPYTAAAILSFAFKQPFAVVDGNVCRVLARIFGLDISSTTGKGKKTFQGLADMLLDHRHPAEHNQAMMDFGALCCTPLAPQCENCPFSSRCVAYTQRRVADYPVKKEKLLLRERFFIVLFLFKEDGSFFLWRRAGRDIWRGLYQPFLVELSPEQSLFSLFSLPLWKPFAPFSPVVESVSDRVVHRLTHQKLTLSFYKVLLPSSFATSLLPEGACRAERETLSSFALPSVIRHAAEKALRPAPVVLPLE